MRRVLITGCDGFIGQHMVQAIRDREPGAHIVGIDDNWTSLDQGTHGGRLSEKFRLSLQDMSPHTWRADGPEMHQQFDLVVHLASPASPLRYQAQPLRTIIGNCVGAIRCVDWCRSSGIIATTSTSEVYGDPIVSPQPESYKGQVDCTGPRACYDESKRVTESLFFDAHRTGRIAGVKVARLFNVYGPGTLPDDGRAVSNFITQALRGDQVTVYGDGRQTRSFTYIDDVVGGFMRFIYETGDFCRPLNIGSDVETPVLHIAEVVREMVASITHQPRVPIIHMPPAVDDPQQRRPDLTLARLVVGWAPSVGYEEGIRRTILHFMERGAQTWQ